MEARDRIEELLTQVRSSGGRATTARRAILQTLIDHQTDHPTAEHITSTVRLDNPEIAESTVYRFLDELARLGIVDHVRLGHGAAVYHFAEDTNHHHLVCNRCGRVTEVPQRTFDSLRTSLLRNFSFEIEPRHFTLDGHCSECDPDVKSAESVGAFDSVEDFGSGGRPHHHHADGHSHPHTHG